EVDALEEKAATLATEAEAVKTRAARLLAVIETTDTPPAPALARLRELKGSSVALKRDHRTTGVALENAQERGKTSTEHAKATEAIFADLIENRLDSTARERLAATLRDAVKSISVKGDNVVVHWRNERRPMLRVRLVVMPAD